MDLRRLRETIFLPSSPEYFIPWLLGLSASLFVGVFGIAGIRAPELPTDTDTLGGLVARLLVVGVFDAALLWTHLRPFHLTWRIGRWRFWWSFAVFSLVYLIVWGVVMIAQGKATVAMLAGTPFDLHTTLNDATAGLTGFALALLVPSWWKGEEPGVANVRREREHALAMLDRLVVWEGLVEADYRTLVPALQNLVTSADALIARLDTARDRALLLEWRSAAEQLRTRFAALSFSQADQINEHGYGATEKAAHAQLQKNC